MYFTCISICVSMCVCVYGYIYVYVFIRVYPYIIIVWGWAIYSALESLSRCLQVNEDIFVRPD